MKHIKKILYAGPIAAILLPAVSFAAVTGTSPINLSGIKILIQDVGGIFNALIPVLFAASLVFFFWGLAQFILRAGDEKTHEAGKQKMLWGVIALFVFIGIYGILRVVAGTLNIPIN